MIDVADAGMITGSEGVIVKSPVASLIVQSWSGRVILCKIKGVLPGPPVVAFQVTRISLTVSG